MNLSELCIRRPVLTTLVTTTFIVFGIFVFRIRERFDTVDVSALGQLQPVTTYTAELTIRDEMGVLRVGEPVTITTSDPALLTVNGVTAWIDAEHPLAIAADARGKVSVMTETASLSAPLLVVSPGFLPAGEGVVVELNGAVQARPVQGEEPQHDEPQVGY